MEGKLSNGSKEIFEGKWNHCYFPLLPCLNACPSLYVPPLLIITIGVLSNIEMNEGDVEDREEGEGRAWCVDGQ